MDDIWPDRRGRSRGTATVHSAGAGTTRSGSLVLLTAPASGADRSPADRLGEAWPMAARITTRVNGAVQARV
jgi:hypothetical protein